MMVSQILGQGLQTVTMKLDKFLQSRNNQFLSLQLVGWIGWVILFRIRDMGAEHALPLYLYFIDAISGLLLTYILRYIYRIVWERSVVTRILTVLTASYAIALIWQPMKNATSFYYWDEFDKVAEWGFIAYFNGILGYSYFLMIGWSAIYFGIKYYQLLQEERQKSIKANSMAHEAQLRMLRYQLNPHFLFNTLNAISTLVLESKNEIANAMIGKLSSFLRHSLDIDPMQKVDLENEINTMKLYLEIEQVRFEDRLRVEYDIDDLSGSARVPSLLLQPLVENSIKYAVATSETGGTIRIKSRIFAQELLLEISDDGPGIDMPDGKQSEFKGVGINNTRERLQEMYGADHSCKFGNAEPSGLKISIRIPYETK
jgi:two-component system LytT family sensor kinase